MERDLEDFDEKTAGLQVLTRSKQGSSSVNTSFNAAGFGRSETWPVAGAWLSHLFWTWNSIFFRVLLKAKRQKKKVLKMVVRKFIPTALLGK